MFFLPRSQALLRSQRHEETFGFAIQIAVADHVLKPCWPFHKRLGFLALVIKHWF